MKEHFITRSLKSTVCTVLCLNIETAEPTTETVIVPRTYKDDKSLFEAVERAFPAESKVKPVHVVNAAETVKFYRIAESDFIRYAEEIDKRTADEADEEKEG